MSRDLPLPTIEERDQLLTVVFGADTRPSCSRQHRDPKNNRHNCDECQTVYCWRQRMYRRFNQRGLRLSFDPRDYHDPEPPACTAGHATNAQNRKMCEVCAEHHRWKERERKRLRREGHIARFTDLEKVRTHLLKLRGAGMTAEEIADAAGCGRTIAQQLITETGRTRRHWIRPHVARALLAVPVPDRKLQFIHDSLGRIRRRIDATGTTRRIRAACRAGWSIEMQSQRLGWAPGTIHGWLRGGTVPIDAAHDVAELFPTLIARPGPSRRVARLAARAGWVEARYFSPTNIDDPAYDPFVIVDNPVGAYRMLRALAWMGVGPRQVAAFIGENRRQVEIWMEGGPAPAYARHMVEAAFDALAGEQGPDDAIARRAHRLRWAPPLAWYGIDIDRPAAQPAYGLPRGERKTDYPLHSQVMFAVRGWVGVVDLLKEEKIRVVRYLHRQGLTDREIATWLRWNTDAPDGGVDAVCQFRRREGIVPEPDRVSVLSAA